VKPGPTSRRLLGIWVVLMGLLVATYGSAYIPMGAWNSIINLVIAIMKALLVALFFMHLSSARPILRVPAVAALFALALLLGLSLADYKTRMMYSAPWQVPRGAISSVH
jgi:cytochrome c oxidase subunit 4